MKLKGMWLALFVLASIMLCANPAFAAWDRYESIFTTNAQGSTTPQTTFGWNETPWLYVKLRGGADNLLTNWWKIGDYAHNIPVVQGHSDSEFYVSFANWNDAGVKKLGNWQVYVAGFYNNGDMYQENSAFFTVTPEPVSSVLFLLGGAGLAGRSWQRLNSKNKLKI